MNALDRRSLLRQHYLFGELPEETLTTIVQLGLTKTLGNGEVLFQKGDEGDALYGILSGKIRIGVGAPNGKEIILSILEPGDVFGEIALLDGLPRTADATASGTTDLLMIRRRDFVALMERQPQIALHMLKVACRRMRSMNERIEDGAFLDLSAKLAKQLLSLANEHGEPVDNGIRITLPLSQAELGQLLGTSRESINKHLQTWRRDGWIDLQRRKIVIRDAIALRSVIDAALAD